MPAQSANFKIKEVILDAKKSTMDNPTVPEKKRGRPKTEPERVRINAHVLPSTHVRIKAQIIRNDKDLCSLGKVIDKQFT